MLKEMKRQIHNVGKDSNGGWNIFFSGCNIPDSFVSLLAGAFLSILKRNNGGYISCLVDIQLLK